MTTRRKQPVSPYINERVEAIALNDILTDRTYQRDLNHGLVRAIEADLDMPAFGVLLLGMRPDETIACIDGQHRLEVARRLEWATVPAILVLADSPEAEARLFLHANRRGAMGTRDKHRARLRALDEQALRVEAAVAAADLRIEVGRVDEAEAHQCVRAIGKLYVLDARYGAEMVTRVLRVARDAWHGESYEGKLLHALAIVLATYVPDRDGDAVTARRLSRKTLHDVVETARKRAPRYVDVDAYANAIVLVHNRTRGPKWNPWVLEEGDEQHADR